MLVWSTRIAFRYMGPELAESYGRRNAVPGELLVRLRPEHVVTEAGRRGLTWTATCAGVPLLFWTDDGWAL